MDPIEKEIRYGKGVLKIATNHQQGEEIGNLLFTRLRAIEPILSAVLDVVAERATGQDTQDIRDTQDTAHTTSTTTVSVSTEFNSPRRVFLVRTVCFIIRGLGDVDSKRLIHRTSAADSTMDVDDFKAVVGI
jgi:hypothetical protein